MLKKFTGSFYTNIYLNAAEELGIDFQVISKKPGIAHLTMGETKLLLFGNFLGVNTTASSKLSRNKEVSAFILDKITTIGPKYVVFNTKLDNPREITQQIYLLAQKNDIVIKAPSLCSGIGIYIHKKTKPEIKRAVHELYNRHHVEKILVEPHFIATEEYRIVIYAGRIIDVLLRKPAFIIGNGKQTIQQLIAQKNIFRDLHNFKHIHCDLEHLTKQGYKLSTIVKDTVYVQLQKVCNLSLGGEVERRPLNLLHRDYSRIAKKLYEETMLKLIGLDLMTTDPSNKPTAKYSFINEFNDNPGCDVPYFADINSNKSFFGVKKILTAINADLKSC